MSDFFDVVTGLAQAPVWVCETVCMFIHVVYLLCVWRHFPGGSDGKYSLRDPGLIPGSGRSPGEFLTGEFHGQRILLWYSPWGCLWEEQRPS